MATTDTPREAFKTAAAAALQANARNIEDRGLKDERSALYVGANPSWPGILELLADAAEAAYGGQPARSRRTAA